jgi:nicotinamidase-related amidase
MSPSPHPERRRALLVVDMQPGFLKDRAAVARSGIIENIHRAIEQPADEMNGQGDYDLVVEATFAAGKDSIWYCQLGSVYPEEETVPELAELLRKHGALRIRKATRSAFQGDVDLVSLLRERGIEEVHIAGVETGDCVTATSFDSFDAGFFTFVLEDCVGNFDKPKLHDAAIVQLRESGLTDKADT